MAFAQSRGVTPELMAVGAERQHRLLERIKENVTNAPELSDIDVRAVQASGQTLALLISNIDEVLGAPTIHRLTLSGGKRVPDTGEEGKYLNTYRRIRGSTFYSFTFPDGNYLLNAAISRTVGGHWYHRNYILRNLNAGWHIDNIRLYGTQHPDANDSGLNFWRSITGSTQVSLALPQSREDIDTLNNRFARREDRERVASSSPSADDLIIDPGQALLFPGSTEVTTEGDVFMAGVAHNFATLSRPRFSSLVSLHFPYSAHTDKSASSGRA